MITDFLSALFASMSRLTSVLSTRSFDLVPLLIHDTITLFITCIFRDTHVSNLLLLNSTSIVVLLGEGRVGKTCLCLRYVKNTFDDNQESTIPQSTYLDKR